MLESSYRFQTRYDNSWYSNSIILSKKSLCSFYRCWFMISMTFEMVIFMKIYFNVINKVSFYLSLKRKYVLDIMISLNYLLIFEEKKNIYYPCRWHKSHATLSVWSTIPAGFLLYLVWSSAFHQIHFW